MPRLSWVIPCQFATVDRFTNSVSLINVVDELAYPADTPEPEPQKPMQSQGFAVVSHWTRENPDKPEKSKARIVLIGPRAKKPLGNAEFDIDLTSFKRARQVSHLSMFPFVGTGDYVVDVQLQIGAKWKRLNRTTIEVKRSAR